MFGSLAPNWGACSALRSQRVLFSGHDGIQILKGLAVAHGAAVIHGDLKPSNGFVTQGGSASFSISGCSSCDPERRRRSLLQSCHLWRRSSSNGNAKALFTFCTALLGGRNAWQNLVIAITSERLFSSPRNDYFQVVVVVVVVIVIVE